MRRTSACLRVLHSSAGASSLQSTASVVAPARANAVTMSTRCPAQVKRTAGTARKATPDAAYTSTGWRAPFSRAPRS